MKTINETQELLKAMDAIQIYGGNFGIGLSSTNEDCTNTNCDCENSRCTSNPSCYVQQACQALCHMCSTKYRCGLEYITAQCNKA